MLRRPFRDLGSRMYGQKFRVCGLGSEVQGLGSRGWRSSDSALGLRILGLGFRGSGFRV